MITAGKLRHRIALEYVTQTADAQTNEPVETWTPWGGAWASVEPVSGNEQFSSMQIQSGVTHAITMRYVPGLTSQWRIGFNGRIFHIMQPPLNTEERDRKMVLMCKEMTDA